DLWTVIELDRDAITVYFGDQAQAAIEETSIVVVPLVDHRFSRDQGGSSGGLQVTRSIDAIHSCRASMQETDDPGVWYFAQRLQCLNGHRSDVGRRSIDHTDLSRPQRVECWKIRKRAGSYFRRDRWYVTVSCLPVDARRRHDLYNKITRL